MIDENDSLLNRLDNLFEEQTVNSVDDPNRVLNVAQYKTKRVLGGGGFGIVYLAEDTELDRLVALKLPRFDALFDAEKRRRFAAEAKAVARLNHSGIVQIYEANLEGAMPFIASEFCDGPNLSEWLSDYGQLPPWRQCAELVANIADAVDYAHQHQVFHRDLKPANIMLTLIQSDPQLQQAGFGNWELKQCRVHLTDFGLAKLIDSAMTETRTSQVLGTPLYMAPEQIEQDGFESPTPTIDIYSLGVILFEVLTGQVPINGSSYIRALDNIRTVPASSLSEFRKGLPRDLESISTKCLEKNPDARYASASELAVDLRRCAQGQPILGKRAGIGNRIAYWCTRPQRVATAGWFGISSVSLIALWIVFNVLALPIHETVTTAEWLQGIRDLGILVVAGVFPATWLSWKTVQGNSWALRILAIYSIVRLPLLIRAMILPPVYFSAIYQDNPTFSFVDHSIMVIVTTIQIFLCTCGILAKRKMRKASGPSELS